MHGHVRKRVKMHRKPTSGANKHGKHNIEQSGRGKGIRGTTDITKMHPKRLHPNKVSWVLDVTKQDQAHEGRQAWKNLELERLT